LDRTARARPDALAFDGWSYGQLDVAVNRLATTLIRTTEPGSVIAVASSLQPEYAVVYYAALRAGMTVLPVVPLLREPQLAYVLSRSGARIAFVTDEMLERVRAVKSGLPLLESFALLDTCHGEPGISSLADWLHPTAERPPGPDAHETQAAALHFTSGTTGMPKCVVLTHANLVANALQTAWAHQLGPKATSVVSFPSYHPMHLNSAVASGAHQVLHAGDDPVDAIRLANASGASHLYTMPARLIRLANNPRLPELRLRSVRFIASGGSALPAAVAGRLQDQFQVPVLQGYGLAETAPLTHFDTPSDSRPGTVGWPLPDTTCRTVDLDTRELLPSGSVGEVQVRGPQVMAGYLRENVDSPGPIQLTSLDRTPIDDDGWFSTGDIGVIEADGRLRLVDRAKDVFKRDNWLVSPTEVEAALGAHSEVADCLVLDHPDDVHGAVPHALIVLRDPAPANPVAARRVAAIIADVNTDLPSFKQIEYAESVTSIPRSPAGKVQRRELRHSLHTRISGGSTVVILLNKFTLTTAPEEFERIFAESSEFMKNQPGFISHTLVKSLQRPNVYVNIAHWESAEDHLRVVSSEGFREHISQLATVARAEPDLYSAVLDVAVAQH
jgi:long-chain acyl-CoA synthetase